MSNFFSELRRRKVYRVAAAYVVAAAGIIQLASATFPAWELPNWSLRLVIVPLLIGFPIALILAWAFDVTPEGIRTTPTLQTSRPAQRRRNIGVLCAVGLLISAAAAFLLSPHASADKIDKSIAVLPFENLSDDKENAFFADGIQDDILTNLSKIGDLKVISRTSVMSYRGQKTKVREIGKALGVGALLEGSVRRDRNNRVRVNVQLINAKNDQHIWSEVYDRDLTDVFAIQTDLAQKIADGLQAKLSPSEKAQITHKPTENHEAYFAFVQAHNLQVHLEDEEKIKTAAQLYERALQLDPNFALAAAESSRLESWIYHDFDPTPPRREKARALALRALQLQPDSPEAHLALGFSYYYGDHDYERAMQEFIIARRGLPNSPEVHLAIGAIQRRQGKWNESTANLEKAAALAPNDTWPLQNLALNYEMTRNYEAANKTVDRALKLKPQAFAIWGIKAEIELLEKGTFEIANRGAEALATIPFSEVERTHNAVPLAQSSLLQRKYPEALREAEGWKDELLARASGGLLAKYSIIGIAKILLGDTAGGREALQAARDDADKYLSEAPNDSFRHSKLARILAWLGEKERAIAEAKRATELLPETTDAFNGPEATRALAEVYAIVGEQDKAIDLLDRLLTRPASLSVPMLKVLSTWDPLRSNPRFEELLRKHSDA